MEHSEGYHTLKELRASERAKDRQRKKKKEQSRRSAKRSEGSKKVRKPARKPGGARRTPSSGGKPKPRGRPTVRKGHGNADLSEEIFEATEESDVVEEYDPTVHPYQRAYEGKLDFIVQRNHDTDDFDGGFSPRGSRRRQTEAKVSILGSGDSGGVPNVQCLWKGSTGCHACNAAQKAFSTYGSASMTYRNGSAVLFSFVGGSSNYRSHYGKPFNLLINCGTSFRESLLKLQERPGSFTGVIAFTNSDLLRARALFEDLDNGSSSSSHSPLILGTMGNKQLRPLGVLDQEANAWDLHIQTLWSIIGLCQGKAVVSRRADPTLFRGFCVEFSELDAHNPPVGEDEGDTGPQFCLVYFRVGPEFGSETRSREIQDLTSQLQDFGNSSPMPSPKSPSRTSPVSSASPSPHLSSEVQRVMAACQCDALTASTLLEHADNDCSVAVNLYLSQSDIEESSTPHTPISVDESGDTSDADDEYHGREGYFNGCTLVIDIADLQCRYDQPYEIVNAISKALDLFGGIAGLDGPGVGQSVVVGVSHNVDVNGCVNLLEVMM